MSKRLQVLLDEAELREIQRAARAQRLTVAEWVRQTLRGACRREPPGDIAKKLAVVRAAARHAFPTGDIGQAISLRGDLTPRQSSSVIDRRSLT